MHRKTAILGANGFVGRNLLSFLAGQGAAVLGIVRSEAGATVVKGRGGTSFLLPSLEISSTDGLDGALRGCDGLVYTASVSATETDRTDPQGLVNVISACRRAGVPRVVFFSGLGVANYGMNPHCTNAYFLAKMAGEVEAFRSGLSATVFRPSYIVGEGDEFLAPLVWRLSSSAVLEIPGDGRYRIQPVSVEDTCRAVVGALGSREPKHHTVDLVGPEILSYRDLASRLATRMKRSVDIRSIPVERSGMKPHELACLLCDEVSEPSATQALVGRPLETLEVMFERILATRELSGARS